VHSATYDNTGWEISKKIGKFNAGFYVMKPNLAYYDLLIEAALNKSVNFPKIEQTCLNYLYNQLGAIPWTYFSEMFDYFPMNGERYDVKPTMLNFGEKILHQIFNLMCTCSMKVTVR
jgi:alpha-N-acetylglucosamine transferase